MAGALERDVLRGGPHVPGLEDTLPDTLSGPLQGSCEARLIDRLEQVIQRAGFEGSQGVLVVGGDEDDSGRQVRAKHLQHIEATALGHFDIEKDQVRFLFAYIPQSVGAGAALSQQLNFGFCPQKCEDVAARQRLIVYDERPQRCVECGD